MKKRALEALCPSPLSARPIPYGLVSLWDMINFSLQAFMFALIHLRNETSIAQSRSSANPHAMLVGPPKDQFKAAFGDWIEPSLRKLDISPGRLNVIKQMAEQGGTYSQLAHELTALDSDIYHAAQSEWFFHYQKEKGYLLIRVARKWTTTLKEFPIAKPDIEAGVDCYALHRHTASVFHFVRVAEHGLRAIGKERKISLPRNKKIEYAQWGEVIGALDKEVERIHTHAPAGKHKDEALAFYTGVVSNLRHIKDKYRNNVMHARAHFDEGEALSAMMRTQELMETLSAHIDERGRKKKRWRL